jgi:hypothetical protein
VGIAVEPDNELDGALCSAAAAAGPDDLGFPIGVLLVKAANGLTPFGNGRPGFVRAGRIGHKAAGGNGNLARVRGFALGHPKTAGLFGRGREFRGHLGIGIRKRQRKEGEDERSTEDERGTSPPHGHDGSTVSSLAATDTTA